MILRISSGSVKNKKLKAPRIERFRAVQEIAKQAAFAILSDKIVDADVLDLFAGTGNLGLEALSRGAKHCTFVDHHYDAIKIINENIANCRFTEQTKVIKEEAVKFVVNCPEKFDVVFLDPFYSDTSQVFLFKNIENVLNTDATVIFFHHKDTDVSRYLKDTRLKIQTERRFGVSVVSVLKLLD